MTGSNHPVPEQLLSALDITTLTARAHDLARMGSLFEPGRHLPPSEAAALAELTTRLTETYPFHDARYAGQMLKPPHPLAWAAYAITMLLNPNNHAADGGPATAELEREAVAQIAAMCEWPEHLGHLTTSGTIANLEALWVARQLAPGRACAYSAGAHYTHGRMAGVLGMAHVEIPIDDLGRMDVVALEKHLVQGEIAVVVATLGTTSIGALDQVDVIGRLCREYGVRLHVDAAYGGFYRLLADEPHALVRRAPFAALTTADSIVIDPHKHGLQPYGCGCVLFADPTIGRLFAHDSPYTYFRGPKRSGGPQEADQHGRGPKRNSGAEQMRNSGAGPKRSGGPQEADQHGRAAGEHRDWTNVHPGEISLECSRSGAAAAALWTTLRALPLTRAGLGEALASCRRAALRFAELAPAFGLTLVVEPELDIVCYFPAGARSAAEVSEASDIAFDACASDGWHVAKVRLDTSWLARRHPHLVEDAPTTTVLRSCLMKPEHEHAVPDLVREVAHKLRRR